MNVLIIHGWLHTIHVYDELVSKLKSKGFNCHVLGFNGMDNSSDSEGLPEYAKQLTKVLSNSKFDIIVAHSMGGRILIECLGVVGDAQIVLLNPVYNNMKMWIRLLYPMIVLLLKLKFIMKGCNLITNSVLKVFTLPTCNSWKLIDESILNSIRTCNSDVAIRVLRQMLGKVSIGKSNKNVHLILSRENRILNKPEIKGLECIDVLLAEGGHSTVKEDEGIILQCIDKLSV